LLRSEGLYSSLISSWRTARDQGAEQALARAAGRPKADPRDKKIDVLQAEVERLRAEHPHGNATKRYRLRGYPGSS
jgi:hypothetical protein